MDIHSCIILILPWFWVWFCVVPSFQRNLADQEMPQGTQLSQLLQEGCVPQFGEKYWGVVRDSFQYFSQLVENGMSNSLSHAWFIRGKRCGFSAISTFVACKCSYIKRNLEFFSTMTYTLFSLTII